MSNMERYKNVLEHFGIRNQMKKLNEECFELLEAISNYEDDVVYEGKKDNEYLNIFRDHIIEEMADILTILTQFIVKYNIIAPEIDGVMEEKLTRTEERIKSGYYDKNID